MSRASSVEEIRERHENDYAKLGMVFGDEVKVYFDAEQAHADITRLLEIAEAAEDLVKRAARIPGENDIVTEYNVRRMDMKRLRDALEADRE